MWPIICLSGLGVFWMFVADKFRKPALAITLLGILVTLYSFFLPFTVRSPMMGFDSFYSLFGILLVLITSAGIFLCDIYRRERFSGMQISLLLFATVGALVMLSWQHFLTLFLGLEMLSIPLYVLTCRNVENPLSQEAGLKYFLLGSFASAVMLFGMGLYFSQTGQFVVDTSFLSQLTYPTGMVVLVALVLLFVGVAFKLGLVPFHQWVPDVYQGAPTAVTGWMSVLVKVTLFAVLYKFLLLTLPLYPVWRYFLISMAVLSLLVGNGLALRQTSLKRLIGYSGIAHAGFMLLIFLPASLQSVRTLFVYSIAYFLAIFGVFIALLCVEATGDDITLFRGLWYRNRYLSILLIISLASLAGIPPLPGFFAKLLVLFHLLEGMYFPLILFAMVNFLVGIYYYSKVVLLCFEKPHVQEPLLGFPLLLKIVSTIILAVSLVILFFSIF
jgi:NADH-quinone oxidoreductase subunit N